MKLRLLASAMAVFVPATNAAAQQTSQPAPEGQVATEEQLADTPSTGDIVVTAQRRDQRLQDVPIAVSAFTAATLESRSITSSTDLGQVVPNLVMYQQATSVTPFLRGIGTKNSVAGDENSVATYVDGVYISSAAAGVFALANIERIEVLRGPQGTLFGRNAAAGVVQVITKDPSAPPSARVEIGYGNYDTFEGKAYANTGIAPGMAADIALYYLDQQDGFGTNLFDGRDIRFGHEFAARAKLKAELSDTVITLSGDYDKVVPQLAPLYRARPGFRLQGNIAYPGFYNANINYSSPGRNEQYGFSGTVEHDFGPVRLVSITAYRRLSADVFFDADGTPAVLQQAKIDQESRTFSQELQLQSPRGSAFDWILGAYYWRDRTGVEPLNFNVGGNPFDRFATQRSRSYAGFAQATVPLGSRSNITGGLRYTSDERRLEGRDVRATGTTLYPERSREFGKLTWRLSLDHRFSPQALVYVQYNRGFKSGVFNLFAPADPEARPQVVDTFESGLKTDLFNRRLRLNFAAFLNDFKDIQLQVPVGIGQPTRLYNAASGRSAGVEVEFDATPVPRLRLSGGAAYLFSEYTDFPFAPYFTPNLLFNDGRQIATTRAADGNRFLIAPKWTANASATYSLPTAFGSVDLNASDAYQSSFFFDVENRIREPGRHLVNGSVDLVFGAREWVVSAWAKNLTATRYHANIVPATFGDTGFPGSPRTYGVRVSRRF